jgi:hypothetical protein
MNGFGFMLKIVTNMAVVAPSNKEIGYAGAFGRLCCRFSRW